MSIAIKFYPYLQKRHNSTLQPSTQMEALATTFDCELKTGTSIINPTILLKTTSNPSQWNYCYIESFARYYFVNDWNWLNGIWAATLSCDVLATYKTRIGNSSQYILRAASENNTDIVDTLYPVKTQVNNDVTRTTFWDVTYGNGIFIVGVASGKSSTIGACAYYAFTTTGFKSFCNTLMSSVDWLGEIDDIGENLLKSLVNPLQYITSVQWFPLSIYNLYSDPSVWAVTSIQYSWYTISVSGCYNIFQKFTATKTFSITIKNHPQASSKGEYMNFPPYSRYSLEMEPFGTIPIDAYKIAANRTVRGRVTIDLISGDGFLYLTGDGNDTTGYDNVLIAVIHGQVGVEMPIAQVTQNILGAAGSVVGAISGAVSGGVSAALSGNIAGAAGNVVSSLANGVISATENMAPEASIKGSAGTLSSLIYNPAFIFQAQFFLAADSSNSHFGSPLCANRTINTLSGYIRTADADITMGGTEREKEMVKQFLDGGFFYE